MKNKVLLVCVLLLFTFHVKSFAVELIGEGRGETERVAKDQALSALAESIFVEIKSEFESVKNEKGELKAEKRIHSRSDLPILGADFSIEKKWGGEYHAKAVLQSGKAGKLYAEKLNLLHDEIMQGLQKSQDEKISANRKYDLLVGLQARIDQYYKLANVAVMLGFEPDKPLTVSKEALRSEVSRLEKEAASVEIAAETLSKLIHEENIYVYPPSFQGSHEITPFGRLLKHYLAKNLSVTDSYQSAAYHFKGEYEPDVNGLFVSYKLLDRQGNTLHVRSVKLLPAAYKGIEYETKTTSFDQLLHQGYVVKSDFQVEISTSRGKEDLLFEEGNLFEIFIKLNQPGYFYIVGHTLNDSGQLSYLLELMEARNDRKFVRYVNADDANKWISLGEFEASSPFGVESLQVIASNTDLIDKLPSNNYDTISGYHVVSREASKAIVKTRSLKPKKDKSKKVKSSESVLMFTTMEKIK